jgi:putative chitobiose transport system permease protein
MLPARAVQIILNDPGLDTLPLGLQQLASCS